MKRTHVIAKLITTVISIAGLATAAVAQTKNYPNHPVNFIVPYTPGGGTDIIARLVAEKLGKLWKQPVVIQNKPGAGTLIGTNFVKRAQPDGYTFLITSSTLTTLPAMHRSANFDFSNDLLPVALIAEIPNILIVSEKLQVKTLKEFIAKAKSAPGSMTYGSGGGMGSFSHLAMEYMKNTAGIDLLHVPYSGGSNAVTAVIAGEVGATYTVSSFLPQIDGERVRPLAVSTPKRFVGAPEIPTFAEAGLPDYPSMNQWIAMLAPGNTPGNIVAKVNDDIVKIMADPSLKEAFTKQYLIPNTSTPEQLGKLLTKESETWKTIVKDANIKPLD